MGYSFRFAHVADTHLGLNWPVIPAKEDAQIKVYGKAFEYFIEKARENEVDFILHAGDIVENPKPTIPALRRSFAELRKLKQSNIPFIITKGTHDSSREYFEKFGGDFLLVLEEDGKAIYVEKSRKGREFYDLKLDSGKNVVRIYGLGEYGNEQRNALADFSKSFTKKDANFVILLMHAGIIDRPYPIGSAISTTDLRAIGGVINYFALGHDHQCFEDKDNSIYNPGSTEFCSFKEASTIAYSFKGGEMKETARDIKEKGFFIVDVENGEIRVKFEQILARKVFNVRAEFDKATPDEILEGMCKALEMNSTAKNVILRPIIAGTLATGYQIYDLKLKDIQESVDAVYVEWPVCSIEGISKPIAMTSELDYQTILQDYFSKKGWDTDSSEVMAQLMTNMIKGLTSGLEPEEISEEARKKRVLKMIEEFDLSKVKKL